MNGVRTSSKPRNCDVKTVVFTNYQYRGHKDERRDTEK